MNDKQIIMVISILCAVGLTIAIPLIIAMRQKAADPIAATQPTTFPTTIPSTAEIHQDLQETDRPLVGFPSSISLSSEIDFKTLHVSMDWGRYSTLSSEQILSYLVEFKKAKTLKANEFYRLHEGGIIKILEGLHCSGGAGTGYQIDRSEDELPLIFAKHNGRLTAYLWCLASGDVFNTVKLTAKQRAARALGRNVLSELAVFVSAFKGADVQYFAVSISYGAKSFIEENARPTAEVATVVAPVKLCQKFHDREITDQEFLDGCDIYLRDSETHTLMKVTLKAE